MKKKNIKIILLFILFLFILFLFNPPFNRNAIPTKDKILLDTAYTCLKRDITEDDTYQIEKDGYTQRLYIFPFNSKDTYVFIFNLDSQILLKGIFIDDKIKFEIKNREYDLIVYEELITYIEGQIPSPKERRLARTTGLQRQLTVPRRSVPRRIYHECF